MNESRISFDQCLDEALERLEPGTAAVASGLAQNRRRGARADNCACPTVTLVEDDGLLRWIYNATPRRGGGRRALRRNASMLPGTPLRTIPIQDLGSNEVLEAIAGLDRKLTPDQGLRIWKNRKLQPIGSSTIDAKRILLFVHGTFSKSDMFFEELNSSEAGARYLDDAAKKYGAILAFDHPTLAVSPWINALDLERALAKASVKGRIDVVCHSRGGLVVAWWLRLAQRPVDSALFVGSPLTGTSLASPAALRRALDHLATAAKGIELASGLASTMVPFMTVVTGLAKILGKTLQLGADLPILDAAVIAVPGLAAQSRVRNNAEILRLFDSPWPSNPECHAIIGNFKPTEIDAGWRYWKRLRNIGDQLTYGAVDLIFNEPNDLVVDTATMRGPTRNDVINGAPLADLPFKPAHVTQFIDSPSVHHINYFRQPETAAAMRGLF